MGVIHSVISSVPANFSLVIIYKLADKIKSCLPVRGFSSFCCGHYRTDDFFSHFLLKNEVVDLKSTLPIFT